MFLFLFISVFEASLFNVESVGCMEEKGVYETAFNSAVTMLLVFFGFSIAFIILSGYLWSRQQKRI
jgi:hypothetical protein